MDRLLYIAMGGAKEAMIAQSNTNNNLANVNTIGFQEDYNQFRSMPMFGPGHPTRAFTMDERPAINFEKGPIQTTGHDLDVAVRERGYIAVESEDGTEAYTRRGDLRVDAEGYLRNGQSLRVIGEVGPIVVPPDHKIEIGTDGTISMVPIGGTPEQILVVDRIKLVDPPLGELEKGTDGLLRLKSGLPANADPTVEVLKGMVEGSNVKPADSLVKMIELSRKYELQIKMMENANRTEESAISLLKDA